MRPIGPIGPIGPMCLMCLIGLIGLMGCTDEESSRLRSVAVELQPLSRTYVDVEPIGSRAWTMPDGYEAFNGNKFIYQNKLADKSINVYFTQNSEAVASGRFDYNDATSKWRSNVDIQDAGTYYLYGFMPADAGFSAEIAPPAEGSYDTGARLTLHAPTITPSDFCIIVGAKEGTGVETVAGLTTGQFAVAAKASGADDGNFIFLLFEHLYSGFKMNISVDATYNSLRTIKLRELRLKAFDTSGDPIKDNTDVVVTLAANAFGRTPVSEVTYSTATGEATDIQIFNSDDGQTLTTESQEYGGTFAPGNVASFNLSTTYDVYDKSGNLVRSLCTAENKINIGSIFPRETMTRGELYTINMTVMPTYLYVLSEPDLDNPTVKIQ